MKYFIEIKMSAKRVNPIFTLYFQFRGKILKNVYGVFAMLDMDLKSKFNALDKLYPN